MKSYGTLAILGILTTACAVPFRTAENQKGECDRIAAQAIETESAARARDFAEQARNCYADVAD